MSRPMDAFAADSAAVPPKLGAVRTSRRAGLAISVAAAIGVGALLYFFNPTDHAFYPQCFFHEATGLNCPGCGGLRAMHQLLHGNLFAALRLNGLAVMSVPVFAGLLGRELVRRRNGILGRHFVSRWWVWCYLGIVLVFAVVRNLSRFAFLSP